MVCQVYFSSLALGTFLLVLFFLLFFQENDDKPDIFVHSLTDIRTKKAGLQLPT